MTLDQASRTDVGRVRSRNEDNLSVVPELGLYVVADGMGGHQGGDEASRCACIAVEDHVRAQHKVVSTYLDDRSPARRKDVLRLMAGAVRAANERILLEAEMHPELNGMGSTLVILLVAGGRAFVANVGDSRAYLLRDGAASLLTEDHSLFFELLRQGRMTRASAARFPYKNVVTRALGMRGAVHADCFELDVVPGDRLLLCSDGLHGVIEDEDLLRLAGGGHLGAAVEALVGAANAAGGPDNVTAVLVEVQAIDDDANEVRRRNQAMREFPVFHGLSTAEVVRVVSMCERRVYPAGGELFREGEVCDGLYGVLSGDIEVWRGGRALQTFGPGSHLGELSLVEELPRLATAVAHGPAEVLVLSRRVFEVLLRHAPQTSARLLRNLVSILARRLRNTNDELVVLKTEFDASNLALPEVLAADELLEEDWQP